MLAPAVLAAEAATPNWLTIAVAVIGAVSAVGAALVAMKGTFRSADNTREIEFDKAVDADRAGLRAEVAALKTENAALRADAEIKAADRDRYRELYAALRVAVRDLGKDPDKLVGGGSSL
jgi:hypothetical protein